METIKVKKVPKKDVENLKNVQLAECIHDLCVLTAGLMRRSGEDDMIDGIGIGLCTALAVFLDGYEKIPIKREDKKIVAKMLEIGYMLLSAFDEAEEETECECGKCAEESKDDEDEGGDGECSVNDAEVLTKIIDELFNALEKTASGKHDK